MESCKSGAHIESIMTPGRCVWCDAPMRLANGDPTALAQAEERAAPVTCPNCQSPAPSVRPSQLLGAWSCVKCGAVWKRRDGHWLCDSAAPLRSRYDWSGPLAREALQRVLDAVAEGATFVVGPAGEFNEQKRGLLGFVNGPGNRSLESYAETLPEVIASLDRQLRESGN